MLDLSRYLGRWIEIARLPNWFESGAFATADYSLGPEGIEVVNTSYNEEGEPIVSDSYNTLRCCAHALRTAAGGVGQVVRFDLKRW